MTNRPVDVFFYGSYMNFKILEEVQIGSRPFAVGSVQGFELTISNLANLIPAPGRTAFGIVISCEHSELERLYNDHAMDILGGRYLPEAVLVQVEEGRLIPALTYISPNLRAEAPDPAYVDRILGPAVTYGFPDWYIAHIESFR